MLPSRAGLLSAGEPHRLPTGGTAGDLLPLQLRPRPPPPRRRGRCRSPGLPPLPGPVVGALGGAVRWGG